MVSWMVWRRAEPGRGDRLLGAFTAEAEAKATAGRDATARGTVLGGWGSLPRADAPAEAPAGGALVAAYTLDGRWRYVLGG